MGRVALPATASTGGRGRAPLTAQERYRDILATSAQSAIITGIELLLLEEPVLKLRAHVSTLAFVEVFSNTATGKTSFALIQNRRRIFGADNTRGWHVHPFDNPENHHPCEAMCFESFLQHLEAHKAQWGYS